MNKLFVLIGGIGIGWSFAIPGLDAIGIWFASMVFAIAGILME